MRPARQPRISVAMCTYNGSRYLSAQLESIQRQDLAVNELIVCDDGSTDDTLAIVRIFADRAPFPVHVYSNEQNMGSSKNFEKAIRLCTGDLIALTDQDDLWYPNKTAVLLAELIAHPSAGAIFSDAAIMDRHSTKTGSTLWQQFGFTRKERQRLAAGNVASVLLRRPVVTGATLMFRSALRKEILPIPPGWVHDEWIAWRVALRSGIIFTEAPIMAYRTHESQQIGVPEGWTARAGNAWKALRHGADSSTRLRIRKEYLHGARELGRLTANASPATPHSFEQAIQAKVTFCEEVLSSFQRERTFRLWFALTNIARYRRFRYLPMYSLFRDLLL